jgi:hypothetical protein
MDFFEEALAHMREGGGATRKGWNGKDMWVALQTPDEHSKMRLPYLYISTINGDPVPWVASQTDLLADDWQLL